MPFVDIAPGETRPRVTASVTRLGRIALLGAAVLLMPAGTHASEPSCPEVVATHLDLPATRAAISQGRPVTIVALGSSSTEGAGATAPDRTYPARLDALLHASWSGVSVTVQNRGIGGQTVDAVLPRLNADVIAAKPTLVIWQVGTNEALRGMDPAHFEALLDEGLRRLSATGSDVILMDYQLAPRMPPEEKRSVYRVVIANEAKAHADSLFSRVALMRSWQAADPTAADMISPDGLHHTDRGYACLAAALDKSIVAATTPRVAVTSVDLK